MKLFLTATSERGKPVTKSGNDHIKIIVKDEKQNDIYTIILSPNVDSTHLSVLTKNKHIFGTNQK